MSVLLSHGHFPFKILGGVEIGVPGCPNKTSLPIFCGILLNQPPEFDVWRRHQDAIDNSPKRRLEEPRARFYAAEITLALFHLHDMGLMYR